MNGIQKANVIAGFLIIIVQEQQTSRRHLKQTKSVLFHKT